MKKWKRYLLIFQDVKIPWFLLALYLLLCVIQSHVEVNTVTLTSTIIDTSQNLIKTQVLIEYISFIVVSGVVSVLSNYISGVAYQKINMGVRTKLWRKIMRLPLNAHDADNGAGLITRVTTDADSASSYIGTIISIATSVYAFIVALEKQFSYNVTMTWALLSIIPFSIGFGILYSKVNFRVGAYSKTTLAQMGSYLAERVRNFRLIKSACTEQKEMENGDDRIQKTFRAGVYGVLTNLLNSVGSDIISLACLVISFAYGGRLVSEGVLSIGRVLGFYSLGGMLTIRVMQVINYTGMLSNTSGTMQRVADILSAEEECQDGSQMDRPDEDIHFENVTFGYDPEQPILHNVSCTIPQGKITAIIGPNGAGKSTMFKLLERMYTPTTGKILYGDMDCSGFSLDSWRKSFGIVSQDDMVMSGTVRENICYGVERKITEKELEAVAKRSNVYEFVMQTPGGFDAQVGADGGNFSGGQRQCIAIARAMMRNPDYLLLDESTSNLDVKSEVIVSTALANLMQGRTTVMIAHNYSATMMADKIIVMNNGRVEAEGTPDELLKTNEYYRIFARRGS